MAKKRSATSASDGLAELPSEISVEAAVAELQDVVRRMESGQATLEESLEMYERGIALVRRVQSQLDAAARRIEVLTKFQQDGSVETAPFEAEATLRRRKSEPTAETGQDGALF